MSLIFYTTIDQEEQLDIQYYIDLKKKKIEIEERIKKTNILEKYTEYAFIKKSPRIFYFIDGITYIEINGKKKFHSYSNTYIDEDLIGNVYKTYSKFNQEVKKFLIENQNYKITFYIGDKNNNNYSHKYDTPSIIESLDNDDKKIILKDNISSQIK